MSVVLGHLNAEEAKPNRWRCPNSLSKRALLEEGLFRCLGLGCHLLGHVLVLVEARLE